MRKRETFSRLYFLTSDHLLIKVMIATTLITLSIAGTGLASYAPKFVGCPGNSTLLRLTGTPASANQTLNVVSILIPFYAYFLHLFL